MTVHFLKENIRKENGHMHEKLFISHECAHETTKRLAIYLLDGKIKSRSRPDGIDDQEDIVPLSLQVACGINIEKCHLAIHLKIKYALVLFSSNCILAFFSEK